MDRATRRELLETIESQKEQLGYYETKLRDLVTAYKGILKEKAALENTVRALSKPSKPSPAPKSNEEDGNSETFQDPLQAQTGEESHSDLTQLQHQLATLTTSLATLSEEKSKMEAMYLAEKKKLRHDHETSMEQLRGQLEQTQLQLNQRQEELTEWRTRVRSQQHEREKEQSDHAMMLRELQKLLAEERGFKEQLEHQASSSMQIPYQQLDDARQALQEKQNTPEVSEQYERQVRTLSQELEAVRTRLKASEDKASKPSPLLLKLQEEMAELKAQHRIAIQQEQRRANEAEDRLNDTGQRSEERVSVLELKLSELSEVVGSYERLRFQDQTAIQKLRERVTQLDQENTALARAAHRTVALDEEDADDSNLDIQALVDKITRLKGMLKLANERSEKPVNIEELLEVGDLQALSQETSHKRCNEEYQHLKEEFERYKLRAQSVLKNKKEAVPNQELESFKSQVTELKERLRDSRKQHVELEEEHKEEITKVHATISTMAANHKHEISCLEAAHKTRMEELEVEIRKHRDRTVALLAEKDNELEMLRARTPESYQSQYVKSFRQMSQHSTESDSAASDDGGQSRQPSVDCVNELISKTSLVNGPQAETSLLHFAQEQARKDVELASLRKQKHGLELALREMQQSFSLKEQNAQEEQERLQEEVRRLERSRSRESANLEYLKNVVYQYMVSWDTESRQQMLKAIATILQFSPVERDTVEKRLQYGWWGKGHQAKAPKT